MFSFSQPKSNKKSITPYRPVRVMKQGWSGASKNGPKHKSASRLSKGTALGTSQDDYPVGGRLWHFFGQLAVTRAWLSHTLRFIF